MSTGRSRVDLRAVFRLAELADYVVPFAVRAVCDLGVADRLAAGPRTVAELAGDTGAHAPALLRALRALACKGIFSEVSPGCFALTPMAELLRSDHPLSLRGAYPLLPGDVHAWALVGHTLRTGKPAFDLAHGMGYWEYMTEHPDESNRFDGAQEAQTRLELQTVLRMYDWSGVGMLVDVGGGNGSFLAGLLTRHPGLRGVLLDLPRVVAGAGAVLERAGVADRCEVVAGDFFRDVPRGADAYLLKRILYGWHDERAAVILRLIRDAMTPASRLLVIEPVVKYGSVTDIGARYDLSMLVMTGTASRGMDQMTALLEQASLTISKVINTPVLPLIEARPS
jgi:O-methyltransferase domain